MSTTDKFQSITETPFEALRFKDDFMFKAVLSDPDNLPLAKHFLELILHKVISSIQLEGVQLTQEVEYNSHGVIFDVQFVGEDTFYTIEMQNYHDSLIERGDYYHAIQKVKFLKAGHPYSEEPHTVVIFLCTYYDPFDQGLPVYTCVNHIQECPSLQLESFSTTIYVNTTAHCSERELQAFFDFINKDVSNTEYTSSLKKAEQKVLEDSLWRKNYMSLQSMMKAETEHARKEGKEEGDYSARLSVCRELLKNHISLEIIQKATGLSLEDIRKVQSEEN